LPRLDGDESGITPRRYLRAGAVAMEPDGWQRVAVLKLALLVRGSQPGLARSRRYDLFGPDYVDTADSGARLDEAQLPVASRGLLRRLYTATVYLRNRKETGS